MAETTGIAWTRSTFNSWLGCTEVSPGCDNCYARQLDKRHKWGGATHWGPGVPRHRTSASYWKQPLAWNKAAADEKWRADHNQIVTPFADRPGYWPVFCASLADVFDNEVPKEWRADLFKLIGETPNLSWLLVTKRIGNAPAMLDEAIYAQQSWPLSWAANNGLPPNVRIMITVVNQEEADRDIPKLLRLSCKNGISYEPALGPIKWKDDWLDIGCAQRANHGFLHWIIVGGESGHKARPFDIEYARNTVRQCKAAGVPVFVKQLGAFPISIHKGTGHKYDLSDDAQVEAAAFELGRIMDNSFTLALKDRAGADPSEWPDDLRVQEFPA